MNKQRKYLCRGAVQPFSPECCTVINLVQVTVLYHAGPNGICGGQCGTVAGFSPSTSCFLCELHSANAPHLYFFQLPTTLYETLPCVVYTKTRQSNRAAYYSDAQLHVSTCNKAIIGLHVESHTKN